MKRLDPIELALFRHLFGSIAEEMGIVLRKTSFSANIKERRDYSCALYDAAGETVAMGDHMPVHLGAMPEAVRQARAKLRFEPGDVALLNDPFCGGTHLPDITAVAPVFLDGGNQPGFWLANRAHHADVGGMSPGSMPLAREVYQEGIRIPPIHIVRRDELRRDVLDLILANVRTPAEREGDLRAQLMSLQRGEARLREAVARYGMGRIHRNMAALCDYSERMMRAALASIQPGTFRFEDFLDGDGVTPGRVRIRVAITIGKNRARVDFAGTDEQREGPVNANLAVTQAAVAYAFRCLLGEDVPFTAGLMRPVTVAAPAGTVVSANLPAAMAAGNVETSQRITDAVLGALVLAAPQRVAAASSGTMNNLSFGGRDPRSGRRFTYYETIAGGSGAHAGAGGLSAVQTHMTNSWNTPVEAFEHLYPMRVRQYRVRRGSGGRGRNRGGDGVVKEFEFLTEADVTILADRQERGPWGLAGGEPGWPGVSLHNGRRVASKSRFAAAAGDRLEIRTPGGGGHG
jgi:N-methylhydantoinase B/oxoprolinase/acetone carboxylase alpha subunit